MEEKLKHLDMIQNIISRMATCSFSLKRWTIILVVAVLGFATKDSKLDHISLAFIPTLFFWGLDGFYLRREKLFRELYDDIRILENLEINFSMDTREVEKRVKGWLPICLSRTIWPFYLAILTIVLSFFLRVCY